MAAKNKPANRATSGNSGSWDASALRLRASRRREELIEEARALLAAGRVREARAIEKRAGQVEQLVGALECEGRAGPREMN